MKLRKELEKYRFQQPPFVSPAGASYGLFAVPFRSAELRVMACDGADTGWDHVSVSLPNRCPNWEEMCHIKELFFGEDETVLQFHPRKSEYVNIHPHCLHLWRPVEGEIELPPQILV